MVCPYFVAMWGYTGVSGYPFRVISGVPYGFIESSSLDEMGAPATWRFERLSMYRTATPANAITASPPTTLPAMTAVLLEALVPEDLFSSLIGLDVGDGVGAETDGLLFDIKALEASTGSSDVCDVGLAAKRQ
jgi:hypothetical protein